MAVGAPPLHRPGEAAGVKSPVESTGVVYEADGNSGMLVEDRQAVSERYARTPVMARSAAAVWAADSVVLRSRAESNCTGSL
jgi:hypothetical protein